MAAEKYIARQTQRSVYYVSDNLSIQYKFDVLLNHAINRQSLKTTRCDNRKIMTELNYVRHD